jgi:hypothetical protein
MVEVATSDTVASDMLADPREVPLVSLMATRELTPEEANMFTERDKRYQTRKLVEKIIASLPGILLAIRSVIETFLT